MSVNRLNRTKINTPQELDPIATREKSRVWTGTKKALADAMAKGEIGNNTVLYITDDYGEGGSIDHALSADTAKFADNAESAKYIKVEKFTDADLIPFENGFFVCSGDPSQNTPASGYIWYILQQIYDRANTGFVSQIAFKGFTDSKTFVRRKVGGTWTEWKELTTTDNTWDFYGGTGLPPKCDMKTITKVGTYRWSTWDNPLYPIDTPQGMDGKGLLKVYSSGRAQGLTQEWTDFSHPNKIARRLTTDSGATWTPWKIFTSIEVPKYETGLFKNVPAQTSGYATKQLSGPGIYQISLIVDGNYSANTASTANISWKDENGVDRNVQARGRMEYGGGTEVTATLASNDGKISLVTYNYDTQPHDISWKITWAKLGEI